MENNIVAPENAIKDTSKIDKLRWITVLLQMFVGSATAYVYCISVYIGPLSTKFGWDPSKIVLAYTAMMIIGLPGSALGGILKAKWGNKMVLKVGGLGFAACVIGSSFATNVWMFVILFGVLASFFMYVVYVAQLANIGELFPDKRGFSMGLVIGGITVGSALISPLSEWLVRNMDVMNTVLLQGAVYGGLVFVCGFLIVEAPAGYCPKGWTPPVLETIGEGAENEKGFVPWNKAVLSFGFIIVFVANVFGATFMTGYQGNAILFTQDAVNCSSAQAAWLYSFWLIVLGIAGLVLGFQSDKWTGPVKTQAIYYALTALALVLYMIMGSDDFWAFVVVIFCFALAGGSTQALLPTFVMEAFGSKHFGIIFGFILAAASIGSIVGPQFTTRFDANSFLHIGIGLEAVAAVLMFLACPVLNKFIGKKKF